MKAVPRCLKCRSGDWQVDPKGPATMYDWPVIISATQWRPMAVADTGAAGIAFTLQASRISCIYGVSCPTARTSGWLGAVNRHGRVMSQEGKVLAHPGYRNNMYRSCCW
jgi:hypothetical protein